MPKIIEPPKNKKVNTVKPHKHMQLYKRIFLAFMLLAYTGTITAQKQERQTIKFYFRQGETKIDTSYKTNATELRKLDSLISITKCDSILAIDKFEFRSGVSPEGGHEINKRIVTQRLTAITQIVKQKISLPDHVIDIKPSHTDWPLLRELVTKSDMPYRTEVLYILDNVQEHIYDSNGQWIDGRRKHLMNLRGGKPYNYMFNHFFSMMRYAESTMTLYFREPTPEEKKQKPSVEETAKESPVAEMAVDTIKSQGIVPQTIQAHKPFYMALSTNMLYDLALVPNIGIEFYLGKQWSLQGDWHYAWWKSNRAHNFWRVYGGGVEFRKWLGSRAKEKPLQGHHLGVYGMIATYDFELGGRGYLGDKWSWSAGVGYGYSLPIAKRINFDFGLSVGYLGGTYKEYLPIDDHYVWQTTKERHYFGLTKAYISFVWLLGDGNYNKRRK